MESRPSERPNLVRPSWLVPWEISVFCSPLLYPKHLGVS